MAPGLDLTACSPPTRMPKLKYRNPLPADEQSPSLEVRRISGQQAVPAEEPPTTPSSHASSYSRPSFDSASLTSTSLASTASSASSNDSKTSKKKKTGSVFGFLSLKEPSQLAFEQYAETQRKQALERSTATPTSRPVSTYAAKKLPKNVPRVNSKWDGVPDSLKNRYAKSSYSKSSSGSNKNRHSVMTQSSQDSGLTVMSWNNESKFSVMTDGSRNPPNSIASVARPLSTLTVRDEVQSLPPPPSTTPPPEVTYYYSEPRISGALSVESSLETYRPSSFDIPQIQDSPYDIVLQADHFSRPRANSPASSTDSVNTVVRDTADAIFKKLNDRPQNSLWGDAPPVGSLDRVDEPAVPESHDFLFDLPAAEEVWGDDDDSGAPPPIPHYAPTRPVHNFSRPMSASPNARSPRVVSMPAYRTTPIGSGLPTLYEASLNSNAADETAQDDGGEDDENDDAYSIAPSTLAPSVMSARWLDSSRERLGLGGRLRMNEMSPWEGRKEQSGEPKKKRLSLFGKVTTRA
jgi:hypothetical protein